MTWAKTQCVFTNKPWLEPMLTFEDHNQTVICFTNARNYCARNIIIVLTRLLKQIHLQPASCTRIYCAVNTVCDSCCHHREFTSLAHPWTAMLLSLIRCDVTIVAIDFEWKNITQTTQRRDMRRTSWLTESRWFSFVNTTWLGPGPSLKWDSVRFQAES